MLTVFLIKYIMENKQTKLKKQDKFIDRAETLGPVSVSLDEESFTRSFHVLPQVQGGCSGEVDASWFIG